MKPEIKELATPAIHDSFFVFFTSRHSDKANLKVLEIGAGQGAFTKRLYDAGYDISACDLSPDNFKFGKVDFHEADLTKELPYQDNTFDVVIAVEVMEHLADHENIFLELNRILKPSGEFIFSTPNILSLKSRLRFFLSGFCYSFNPLDMNNFDGMQHISSITYDQYCYLAAKYKFKPGDISFDKKQNTSLILLIFYPLLFLFSCIKGKGFKRHNIFKLLVGRTLFVCFSKNS